MKTSIRAAAGVLLLLSHTAGARAEAPQLRSVTFAVACYDVGRHALEGLPGVQAVSSGWSDGQEVNVVRYDPRETGVPQLEDGLRRAGTYVKTLASE